MHRISECAPRAIPRRLTRPHTLAASRTTTALSRTLWRYYRAHGASYASARSLCAHSADGMCLASCARSSKAAAKHAAAAAKDIAAGVSNPSVGKLAEGGAEGAKVRSPRAALVDCLLRAAGKLP